MFQGFVFPLPTIGSRIPVVSDGMHMRGDKMHEGVDLMYERLSNEPAILPRGTPGYYLPIGTPALAAGPGVVTMASNIGTGGRVAIDHGGGLVTKYMHLAPYRASVGQTVQAGDIIGTVGDNPLANDPTHLHFEVLISGEHVDPEDYIHSWNYTEAPTNYLKYALVAGVFILTYMYIKG